MIESPPARTLIFGPFQIDPRSGELRKNGVKIKLQQKPFQLLQLLLEHPGELVNREELRRKLWPANTFVDFDHSVGTALGKLRQALGDSAHTPRFVQTVGNRGYRFIAPVTEPQGYGIRLLNRDAAVVAGGAGRYAQFRWPRSLGALAASGIRLIGIAVGGFVSQASRVRSGTPVRVRIQSIAVLPLDSLSEDQHNEYFAEGMTDALITELAKFDSLRVISRTSVMRYKKTRKPLSEIAREVKVESVLEGTVMHSRDRVRINAHLIGVPSEKQLWADAYEREMHDELALQAEIARSIANEIRVKLSP